MDFLSGLQPTASALDAEKIRMDIISQNIANANTTRDENGKVYKRKDVSFESVIDGTKKNGSTNTLLSSVRVAKVYDDKSPGDKIYKPGHPHADADGMVEMPNVNMALEMVDLINASRAYEANLTMVKTARQMAQKTLAIGR